MMLDHQWCSQFQRYRYSFLPLLLYAKGNCRFQGIFKSKGTFQWNFSLRSCILESHSWLHQLRTMVYNRRRNYKHVYVIKCICNWTWLVTLLLFSLCLTQGIPRIAFPTSFRTRLTLDVSWLTHCFYSPFRTCNLQCQGWRTTLCGCTIFRPKRQRLWCSNI